MTSPTSITISKRINTLFFWRFQNIVAYLHSQKPKLQFCTKNVDFVAQLVEQLTLNQWAVGSSPTEVTETKSEGLTPNDKK